MNSRKHRHPLAAGPAPEFAPVHEHGACRWMSVGIGIGMPFIRPWSAAWSGPCELIFNGGELVQFAGGELAITN